MGLEARLLIFASMWLEAVLSGVTLGIVLAMLIGPVFFLLIDAGISRGFKSAFYIAAGVMLSDLVFILIAYYSSTAIRFIDSNRTTIGFIGGLILIIFGGIAVVRKPVIHSGGIHHHHLTNGDNLKGLWQGFILNFLNPFVLIFWLGVAGSLAAGTRKPPVFAILFFASALATIFVTDLLKAWGAARLKRLIRPVIILWLNRVSGIGLILFGIHLIWKLM